MNQQLLNFLRRIIFITGAAFAVHILILHYLDLVEESMMSLKLNNELQRTMRMTLNEL